jgi:hypothetical protein
VTKICGVVSTATGEQEIEKRLRSMVRVMKHDPGSPEDYLYFENGGVGLLGNSSFDEERLIRNEERGSCLALCGHAAGYRGGRGTSQQDGQAESDVFAGGGVGSLLDAIEGYGEDVLNDLNGEFVLAYHDPTTRSLMVANDRYGVVPLYYYCEENTFIFASEVKAILRVLRPQELDWESVADFFYLLQMRGCKTLFKNVRALDSGQALTFREGDLKRHQYFDFVQTPVLDPTRASTEKAASLFKQAVRRRIERAKPNTLMLSGGFDSRLILGALWELGADPRAIMLEHARGARTDGMFAALMAEHLRLEAELRPTRKDFFSSRDCLETFYIQDGMYPTYDSFNMEIYPEIDSGLGLVWDGLALDVALGSSRQKYAGAENNEKNLRQFAGGRGRQMGIPSRRYRSILLRLILTPHYFRLANKGFLQRLRDDLARIPESENQFTNFILKHRTRRRVATLPHQLFASKVDAATPAMDADFLEYVLGIPQSLKHNHRFYVDMIKERFPVLAEVPVHSGGYEFHFDSEELEKRDPSLVEVLKLRLARALLFMKISLLERFSPRHTRDEPIITTRLSRLPAELVILILEHKNFDRPYYNKRLLRRLFKSYRNGMVVYHNLFAIVYYIELWHLLFVDEDSPLLFDPKNLETSKLGSERPSLEAG